MFVTVCASRTFLLTCVASRHRCALFYTSPECPFAVPIPECNINNVRAFQACFRLSAHVRGCASSRLAPCSPCVLSSPPFFLLSRAVSPCDGRPQVRPGGETGGGAPAPRAPHAGRHSDVPDALRRLPLLQQSVLPSPSLPFPSLHSDTPSSPFDQSSARSSSRSTASGARPSARASWTTSSSAWRTRARTRRSGATRGSAGARSGGRAAGWRRAARTCGRCGRECWCPVALVPIRVFTLFVAPPRTQRTIARFSPCVRRPERDVCGQDDRLNAPALPSLDCPGTAPGRV
jgi:hypothetical protein